AGVGPRALASHRQAPAMPGAPERADLDEPLDVERDLLAEVAFHPALLLDDAADLPHIVVGEVLHADVRAHARRVEDPARAMTPDSENVSEPNLDPLRTR